MSTTPYQFIKRGNLFITPVGPSISEAPYPTQSFTKPREFSLWVRGKVEEPEFQLDQARMPPSMYQEVRKDLSKYSSVPVSRSAFRRSQHAYVGVIDSLGKPFYFALDSRGFSCREAPVNDDRVWKTFDRLAGEEQLMAIKQRRHRADEEMEQVDRELSEPLLVISKGLKKAKVKIEQWPLLHGSSTSTTVSMPKEKKERFLAAIGKRGGKPPSPSHWTRVTEHGYDTHNAEGERIKKPSLYQRARGLLGKPRTDITEEGHPTKPQLPAARVVRQLGSGAKKVEKAGRRKGDVIPGGLADKKAPSDFDPKKLAAGIKVEMEHTSSRTIAREIAMDHLTEDPRYYEKLKTIEKDCSKTSAPGGCGCHACEVKKALPKKGHAAAAQASFLAHQASDRAHSFRYAHSPPYEHSHEHAYDAHRIAARAFTAIGKHTKAQEHQEHGEWHRKFANQRRKNFQADLKATGYHDGTVEKALPKKSKEEPVKKPKPTSGASKKQMGAGGKTRYTYLQEGKAKLPKPTPLVVALPQETRQNVDPAELANQLGISKLTLTKIASKLGRKGFSRYMRSHLKRFAAKHRLGHDYWDQIYGTVVQTSVQNEEKTFGSP